MHDLNNLENIANKGGKDPFRGFEVAAGIYAADRVAGHMRTVEQQNAEIIESQRLIRVALWRAQYKDEGWTEEEINEHYEDLMEQERRENANKRDTSLDPLIGFGIACGLIFGLYLLLTALGY